MAYFSVSWMPLHMRVSMAKVSAPSAPFDELFGPAAHRGVGVGIVAFDIARQVGRLFGEIGERQLPRIFLDRRQLGRQAEMFQADGAGQLQQLRSCRRIGRWRSSCRTRRGSSAPGRPDRWPGRYRAGADRGCRAAGTSGDARPASPGPNIRSACGGRSRGCAWALIMHHALNGCSTGHATVSAAPRRANISSPRRPAGLTV